MEKRILKSLLFLWVLVAVCYGCKKENDVVPLASLSLEIAKTTSESITFSIIPDENCVAFHYACMKSSEPIENAKMKRVEVSEGLHDFTVDGLEANEEYSVVAKAENSMSVLSEPVVVTAITTTAPSVKIALDSLSPHFVKFTLSPLNAVKLHYACVGSNEAETCRLEIVESSEEQVIELEIEDNTPYTIVAVAENESGEMSERAYYPFRSGIMPVVTLERIEADETSAILHLSHKDAKVLNYAVISGNDEPSEFASIAVSAAYPEMIYVYELENNTSYTAYICAENKDGFKGEMQKMTFNTGTPSEERPVKMVIDDITSVDASVTITYDEERFSACYWFMDGTDRIPDPSSFDWDGMISSYKAIKVYNGQTQKLSRFPLSLTTSGSHRVGVVAVDKEGNVIKESAIWKDVILKNVDFGESNASVRIEQVDLSFSRFSYKVISENASGYYIGCDTAIADIEDYARNTVLKKTFVENFEEEMSFTALRPKKDYTVVVVPVDESGKLGNLVSYMFTTPAIPHDGIGKAEIKVSRKTVCSIVFDVCPDEQCSHVLYMSYLDGDAKYSDEDYVEYELTRTYNKVSGHKELSVNYLSGGEKYHIWFMTVDKDGNYGEIIKFEELVDEPVFDGESEVEFVLNSCVKGQYSGYTVNFDIKPDSNVEEYYYNPVYNTPSILGDDLAFAKAIITGSGSSYAEGPVAGVEMTISSNYGIGIVCKGKDGKWSKPVFVKIEVSE